MRLAACLAGSRLPAAKALFWKTLAPALADSQMASSDLCVSADRLRLLNASPPCPIGLHSTAYPQGVSAQRC